MKLKRENLELMSFKRSGHHESVKNLFYKDLFPGLEIEVDYETGEGSLSILNLEKDLTPAILRLSFENDEHLKLFIEAINRIEIFNHGY
jgi:hypothetical protein